MTKIDGMAKEYITILVIFASIVLGFTSSIVFSTSVLENISGVIIYRLIFISAGLAGILSNLIYILTRFILELNKKTDDIIKYPRFLKIFNWIIVGVIVVIVLLWMIDFISIVEVLRTKYICLYMLKF